VAAAPVVTDFAAYAPLKAQARADDPAALRAAAQQFEALFTQMMLKSMRDASLGENLMDGEQSGLYRDLYDQQIALSMAGGKGLGIADMLVQQLSRGAPAPAAMPAAVPVPAPAPLATAPPAPVADRSREEAFIEQMLPHAQAAGRALGVAPHLIMAQSALETGWGRSVAAAANNAFGIKAGRTWQGPAATLATQEFAGGQARVEKAAFRAYASVAESFADYARFIGGRERYAAVRNTGADSARFAGALQRSGYATDPAYADKIRAIADDPRFQERVAHATLRLGLEA
jgi:peptidoglycan hydrolase FlgJ